MPAELSPEEEAALMQAKGIDPNASTPERMRQVLSQIVAMGRGQNYTDENLWAAQAQRQWPPPQLDLNVRRFPLPEEKGQPDVRLPQRQFNDDERFLRFPTAPAERPEPTAPFSGATSVETKPYSYELPKSAKKKAKR